MRGIRPGTRIENKLIAQGTTLGPYGVVEGAQSTRPAALHVQGIRTGGASAHSYTVEGSQRVTGPWKVLATVTTEDPTKVTDVPDYIRVNTGTVTGGTIDIIITGARS